ncbi:uncharacterized protein LOC135089954 [Scylla paramamosain]
MDYSIRPATTTMRRGLTLHLCLGLLLATSPGLGTAVSDTLVSREGAVQQQQQQQQVPPLVVPEWWWLSSLLSMQHGHRGHTAAAADAAARKVAADTEESPENEGEADTLSLVVPLGRLAEADEPVASTRTAGRVGKRGAVCRGAGRRACRRGELTPVPASKVTQSWEADYMSIPEGLVSLSQMQQEEAVCRDLSVPLFRVDMRHHYVEPRWMRNTLDVGVCPSILQEKRLGENVWPPSVVEVKCLCQQQSCSDRGWDFRCQAVQQTIMTWVRQSSQDFMPSTEVVSVGCMCAQRTGTEGRVANMVES